MKRIIFFIALFLIISPKSFAQNSNSLVQNVDITKQIDQLKDKVASKVAELKLVEKRGLLGKVTDATDTQITITDLDGNIRFVDVDEFTKFSSPSQSSSFGISDIKKGDYIGALGLYNKESRRTLARFVNVMDVPEYITGVIVSKDAVKYDLVVATADKNINVSIENVTKTYLFNEDGKLVKGGFSVIEPKQNIIVSGFFDPKDKNTITAGRIFIFPGVPQNPTIDINIVPTVNPQASIVPSTGSGKKLTPIVR